jgi:tetratricopeptide (TPR) repeat protein
MRVSRNSITVTALGLLAAALLISCQTAGKPTSVAEKPAAAKPEKKAYTRIGFGESLEELLRKGDVDGAIALFATVPEPDASAKEILTLKLSILISAGRLDDAGALGKQLEERFPGDAEVLYAEAILAGAKKDKKGRAAYLGKVLEAQPEHSLALTALAEDYLNDENFQKAKGLFIKANQVDPENCDALVGLARVYYLLDELDKAGDTLNLAIAKQPEYSVLWAERARVESETSRLPQAIEDVKKAIDLDRTIPSQWLDYGNYLMQAGRKEEAKVAFTETLKLAPDHYLALIYRAGINEELGHAEEAIADYTGVNRLIPDYYYASESLGNLLWEKGEYAKAQEAFANALRYVPKNHYYALMYTLCAYRSNQAESAKSFMTKYITTLDRSTPEYFLCRLFADRTGDADVINRIAKVPKNTDRARMLFYMAEYFDLFQSKAMAQKYYSEVTSLAAPTFFEYRLAQDALKRFDGLGQAELAPDGATTSPEAATATATANADAPATVTAANPDAASGTNPATAPQS